MAEVTAEKRGRITVLSLNKPPVNGLGFDIRAGLMAGIEAALGDYFGNPIKLKIQAGIAPDETPAQRQARQNEEKQKAAVESIEQDENVQMMKEMFGATVPVESIQPVEE